MIRLTALLVSPLAVLEAADDKVSQPNIVFILADDLGWKDVGYAGSVFYRTPNIDRLARGGMQFTQAYSAACVCSPSRGAIFSGKNPARTALTTVWSGGEGPDDRLFDRSKDQGGVNQHAQGFRLAAAGGSTRGHWGKSYPPHALANLPELKAGDYLADVLTTEAVKFIHANKSRPFLAVLSHYLVHNPVQRLTRLLAGMAAQMPVKDPGFKPQAKKLLNRQFTLDLATKEYSLSAARFKAAGLSPAPEAKPENHP